MLFDLGLGTLIIASTVLTHTFGLVLISRGMSALVKWLRLHKHGLGKTVAMTTVVLAIFFLHTVEVWTWAVLFVQTGAIVNFVDALYFSTVTFSTVGYGDLILSPRWRLLGALEGVNGFILIGWSTAYLVGASTRYGPFRAGEHF